MNTDPGEHVLQYIRTVKAIGLKQIQKTNKLQQYDYMKERILHNGSRSAESWLNAFTKIMAMLFSKWIKSSLLGIIHNREVLR